MRTRPASIPAAEFEYVPTGISPAYWCSLSVQGAEFRPAKMKLPGMTDPQEIAWFDRLLDGGLRLPKPGSGSPITMLITGPPGSGKTTMAVELCARLAGPRYAVGSRHAGEWNKAPMSSLYVSTDQDTMPLIANAKQLLGDTTPIVRYNPESIDEQSAMLVCGRDLIRPPRFKSLVDRGMPLLPFLEVALGLLIGHHIVVLKPPHSVEKGEATSQYDQKVMKRTSLDVLVVDGLNSVEPHMQGRFFARVLAKASPSVRLILFILDASPTGDAHRSWEYACDLAVRLDYSVERDYYLRTLQVVKARYQAHVWGVHQVKPFRPSEPPARPVGAQEKAKADDWDAQRRREHPYRSMDAGSGGILIYPSIHYYLSLYKRKGSETNPGYVDTLPTELSDQLRGSVSDKASGYPESRCTAFIGARGGHKSHLGYTHLLHRIVSGGDDEAAIVVSLRDDETVTRHTMSKILTSETFPADGARSPRAAKPDLRLLEERDQLEILYYHPGYITPEEFMHRLFVSLHRVKQSHGKVTVLFNSLDQLGSRFPLCARQAIFVPGMIEMLTGEDVTSIFIAVDERDQPPEQYGLLPMADLILSFRPRRFAGQRYAAIVSQALAARGRPVPREWAASVGATVREETVLQVVRFAGGQRAGLKGILELADEKSIWGRPGLHFAEFQDQDDGVAAPPFGMGQFLSEQREDAASRKPSDSIR